MRHERIGGCEAETRLARALASAARAAGLAVTLAAHRSRPWASATFTGARHALTLAAPRAPSLGGWIAGLPEAELTLRGHIVADLAIEGIDDDGATVTARLSVLTIEGD